MLTFQILFLCSLLIMSAISLLSKFWSSKFWVRKCCLLPPPPLFDLKSSTVPMFSFYENFSVSVLFFLSFRFWESFEQVFIYFPLSFLCNPYFNAQISIFWSTVTYLYLSSLSIRLSPSGVFIYLVVYFHRCYQCYLFYFCYLWCFSFLVCHYSSSFIVLSFVAEDYKIGAVHYLRISKSPQSKISSADDHTQTQKVGQGWASKSHRCEYIFYAQHVGQNYSLYYAVTWLLIVVIKKNWS